MGRTLIHNAVIVDGGGRTAGYVVIDGEFIEKIGEGIAAEADFASADTVTDLGGRLLLPGAIDTHVHFREPGLTHKASIATESAAAVSGGVTSFLDMPNTRPATVTMAEVERKKSIAAASAYANYGFFLGATNDNLDEILSADPREIPGIKLFMGSSTGNMLVDDDDTMARLFASWRGVIAVHAEDEAVMAEARRQLAAQYGDHQPVCLHSKARPVEACYRASQRAVELARRYGTRLHLLHISTERELSLLTPGPVEGKRITSETCPHYLLFEERDLELPDAFMLKCNPAIKSAADRAALLQAVADGLIDTVATDHAPHLLDEKRGNLLQAASGMPGTRFLLPAMLTLAGRTDNRLTVERVVELTANNPARLYGIDRRGFIRPGYYADLAVAEPTDPYTPAVGHYLPDGAMSPCNWTPYSLTRLNYRIAATYVNGALAFDGNKVLKTNPQALRFNS